MFCKPLGRAVWLIELLLRKENLEPYEGCKNSNAIELATQKDRTWVKRGPCTWILRRITLSKISIMSNMPIQFTMDTPITMSTTFTMATMFMLPKNLENGAHTLTGVTAGICCAVKPKDISILWRKTLKWWRGCDGHDSALDATSISSWLTCFWYLECYLYLILFWMPTPSKSS